MIRTSTEPSDFAVSASSTPTSCTLVPVSELPCSSRTPGAVVGVAANGPVENDTSPSWKTMPPFHPHGVTCLRPRSTYQSRSVSHEVAKVRSALASRNGGGAVSVPGSATVMPAMKATPAVSATVGRVVRKVMALGRRCASGGSPAV